MKTLYNFIIWLIKNSTSLCLVLVVLTSIHPFVSSNRGHNYYTALGIFFTFVSTIFARWHVKDGIKESTFYNILSIVIMALGVTAIFFISGKKETTPYTDFELFITTYFGALLGLVFGTLANDLINGERKERELRNRDLVKDVYQKKLNWIDVTKQMPKEDIEVLCRSESGGYFVGIIRKMEYHDKIIYECNSGDDGMNHVVCWIYLDEIEATIKEELLKLK